MWAICENYIEVAVPVTIFVITNPDFTVTPNFSAWAMFLIVFPVALVYALIPRVVESSKTFLYIASTKPATLVNIIVPACYLWLSIFN